MSILNDDKKVINERRTNTLKDSEEVQITAPLRDQIVKKLFDRLESDGIGPRVVEIWHKGNAQRTEWLNRNQYFLNDYDNFQESSAEGPFAGSSNLHLPIQLIVAKSYHARFLSAILSGEPYCTVKARTEASIDRANLVQDVMQYTLRDWINHRRGIDKTIDEWLWNWITEGSAVMKLRWDCLYERFIDVELVPEQAAPRFVVDSSGMERAIPQMREVEKEVTRTEKRESPVAEPIAIEDYLQIGGAGDPQMADVVIHRQRLTASELWTLSDRKVFKEEYVKEIINGGGDSESGDIATNIKQQKADNAGKAHLDTESDLDRYEFLEAYLNLDVDGSGINSKVIVWVHRRTGKLVRATYLRRVHKAGEIPFFKIDFHMRPGQDYGVGMIELMHPLAKELDAIHNIRVDTGILANMPFGFYRPASSIDPVTIQYEPGSLIPVDNPQTDVYFPNLGNRTSYGFQEEQGIQTYVERLTGMNDMSLGVMTGAQGATRTATGARALIGESNTNLDVYLRRLNRGWRQFLECLFHTLQQRIPEGMAYRVTGESGDDYWGKIKSQKDLEGDFDFILDSNSSNSNKMVQIELANQIMMNTSNPMDYQIGALTPTQRYEAMKNWYKANGVKDYNRYCQKPPDYNYSPTPAEEIDRISRGMSVPVQPNSDHEGFITLWEEFKNSDELLGQLPTEVAVACEAQARQHMQMAQAMQQQQAQQNNSQQMQLNSQNAQQQSSPGMNPMAGGQNAA